MEWQELINNKSLYASASLAQVDSCCVLSCSLASHEELVGRHITAWNYPDHARLLGMTYITATDREGDRWNHGV